MKHLKLMVTIGIGLIILGSAFYYYYFLAKPSSIPSKEYLKQEINAALPNAHAKTIQDIVKVDGRHLFVPFRTQLGFYAISTWEWKKHKWQVAFIDTKGEPRLWKLDPSDPTSYHLIWNINPQDEVKYIDLYLMRKRNYVVSNRVGTYYPRIQIKKRFFIADAPYNASALPTQWQKVMIDINKRSSNGSRRLFGDVFGQSNLFFGWMPYNNSDEVTYPRSSSNGYGFGNGDANVDYIRVLDKQDVVEWRG